MTTAFEPPDPATPRVLAGIIADSANKTPFAPPADNNPPPPENPGKDETSAKTEDNKPSTNDPAKDQTPQHYSNTEDGQPADGPSTTYTTTEPGFPIGQLIAGLMSAGVGAGTAAGSTLMTLPTMALSTAMPILESLLRLLGSPNTLHALPPAHATTKLPPAPYPDGYTGPAAAQYRQKADDQAKDEHSFDDKDSQANNLIDKAHAANAQASHIVRHAIDDLHAAAAISPATGPAAFAAASRTAIATARTAVATAAAHHQALAYELTAIRATST
jgi:hypothetical protein